ncbi:hypothetical protein BDY19DRAFT_507453 [Irpex rosettiformis]|uniref:Uncharacterized protein n=1 Tax=Irpex rosettiformis TaxID=378272 RepID=A0ACB8UEV2_9APHY|nr:hypothetical protein BDY19DRAFT_507453 [Irpex rosettiformis]
MDRARRKADADRAYNVQALAGIHGGFLFLGGGAGLAIIGHHTWPAFRRQTLAFKGFLTMACGIFGMVLYAENALQALEKEQRHTEGAIRKEARLDLTRRGIVPTETAIAVWRQEREEQSKAAKDETAAPAS